MVARYLKKEGRIELKNGYRVWYRRVGTGNGIPLLTLHGGPGSGHDYLEPLEKLAADRPVIFYDQLGCGRSDQPDDRSLWRLERFVTELAEVREALGLREVYLLGHSSGGMLAIETMLTQPRGVAGLILADSTASMPQLRQELQRLRSELPAETIATLDRFEAAGDFQHPEYRAAVAAFYKRHVCRLSTMPDYLLRTTENLKNNPVYETMNGPNELVITGNLKDWDRISQLGRISVPFRNVLPANQLCPIASLLESLNQPFEVFVQVLSIMPPPSRSKEPGKPSTLSRSEEKSICGF